MVGSKILKSIEVFREEHNIELATKNFLERVYKDTGVKSEQINAIIDDEALEEIVALKVLKEDLEKSAQIEINLLTEFSPLALDFEKYKTAFMKSYYLKISKFFNELILVILSLVIPTVVQLYFIDKKSGLTLVWLTIPITFFSLVRESNIVDFLALKNNYKGIVIKDYFKNIFKGNSKSKIFNILLLPFYVLKWIFSFLHSFIFQYKLQLLFYTVLFVFLTIGYQKITEIIGGHKDKESQITSQSRPTSKAGVKQAKQKEKTLVVQPLSSGDILENEMNQVVYFPSEGQDSVTESDEEKEYSYTAPTTGYYKFEFEGIKEGRKLDFSILNEEGDPLTGGETIELEAGKIYKIKITRQWFDVSYRLKISVPSKILDISKASAVKDFITFAGQKNLYSYTAVREGDYHFGLVDVAANSNFDIEILDDLGNEIDKTGNSDSTFKLKENETYTVAVQHYSSSKLSNYTLNIGIQKPVEDITDYTSVKDSIEFVDQVNRYKFKAPQQGVYGFQLADKMADSTMSVTIADKLKENLGEITSYQPSTTVTMEKGEEYLISVYQENGLSDYTLKIGYAKAERDILENKILSDEITFEKEVHDYKFTPSTSGYYSISLTNDVANIIVLDEYRNQVDGNYSNKFELSKGKSYTIQVVQDGDLGKYEIEVNSIEE